MESLPASDYAKIITAVKYLSDHGPTLNRPLVDRIKGSKYHNMKELRPPGTNFRLLFIFDHARILFILVGGDKSENFKGWYRTNIKIAEMRYHEYLKSSREGDLDA